MRHVDGEMRTNDHDPSTVPRSERPSECPRDRGLLDLDPTAHNASALTRAEWSQEEREREDRERTMAIGRPTTHARWSDREEDPAGWTKSSGSSLTRARPIEQ